MVRGHNGLCSMHFVQPAEIPFVHTFAGSAPIPSAEVPQPVGLAMPVLFSLGASPTFIMAGSAVWLGPSLVVAPTAAGVVSNGGGVERCPLHGSYPPDIFTVGTVNSSRDGSKMREFRARCWLDDSLASVDGRSCIITAGARLVGGPSSVLAVVAEISIRWLAGPPRGLGCVRSG